MRNMFKWALNRGKLYWICVSITAALCYGFALTNFSIGVDDEAINKYTMGGLLAQGRWGSYITQHIFNSYEFLPFWRDFMAVLLIVFGVMLWCYFIQKYSDSYFSNHALIIFSCTTISFPYIAEVFIFEMATIEIGLVITFSVLAILLAVKCFISEPENVPPRYRWLYLFSSILLLSYTISFSEETCPIYLIGIFILCILLSYDTPSRKAYSTKKCLVTFGLLFLVLLISIVVWKVVGVAIAKCLSIQMTNYTSNMIIYDKSNFIKSFLTFVLKWLKMLIDNIAVDRADLIYLLSALVVLVITFVSSIKNKKFIILLFGVGCALSAHSMYFITGNLWIHKRMIYTTCVFVGFACALLFATVENVHIWKIKLKNIATFIMILIVFYQSKSMNEVFFTDYLRYQRDTFTMNSIALQIEELQKNNSNKPIVFVGALDEYNLKLGDVVGHSVFMWDRSTSAYYELETNRIFDFMNMHGYNIKKAENVDSNKIKEQIVGMSSYPHNGYAKDCGDYIIVKIGKSKLE